MRLYLDTSIPNFLFADDAPDKMQVTKLFFEWLPLCPHDICISPIVEDEISAAPESKRSRLVASIRRLHLKNLPVTIEAQKLSKIYIQENIFPVKYESDALHAAIAVCHGVDVLVSWNLEHLVNPGKIQRINRVNTERGYPPIRIQTPAEVMGL